MRIDLRRIALPRSLEVVAATHLEAEGCGLCRYGVIAAPDPASLSMPLIYQRALALRLGRLTLCDCAAGQAQRRGLERVLAGLRDTPVTQCDRGLIWDGRVPAEYVPGSWWAAVRSAELIEHEAHVPTVHGV